MRPTAVELAVMVGLKTWSRSQGLCAAVLVLSSLVSVLCVRSRSWARL